MRDFFPDGPIWFVAFLFSLTCHEAAHALAAKIGGDDTAYHEGQVSLSPWPHMQRSPFGMVIVPLLSFVMQGWMIGWASAPYDPAWRVRYPHRAAWMALAGPVANFLIVLISGGIIFAGLRVGWFDFPGSFSFSRIIVSPETGYDTGLTVLLSILFSLNLLLGSFNLIPVPPLDGATVVGLFLSEEHALKLYEVTSDPTFQFIGLFLSWEIFDHIFPPIFLAALRVLY